MQRWKQPLLTSTGLDFPLITCTYACTTDVWTPNALLHPLRCNRILYVYFVHASRAVKRWSGVRGVERGPCVSEWSAGLAPQKSSVPLLDHTLMRHLCVCQLSERLSDACSACCCPEKQQQKHLTANQGCSLTSGSEPCQNDGAKLMVTHLDLHTST